MTNETHRLVSATFMEIPTAAYTLYRPNVAAILVNAQDEIFIAQRINMEGAWQFPQGGIDEGEDAATALFRELAEEIGVTQDKLQVLKERSGYRYAFPKNRLKYGIYGGQEQTYYLCRFLGEETDINLAATHQEFSYWKWIRPQDFQLSWVPKFKRAVYRQVFVDFFQTELLMNKD